MLYLTQHKRGQVISEQNNRELKEDKNRSNVPDWNGRTSGELNFNIEMIEYNEKFKDHKE